MTHTNNQTLPINQPISTIPYQPLSPLSTIPYQPQLTIPYQSNRWARGPAVSTKYKGKTTSAYSTTSILPDHTTLHHTTPYFISASTHSHFPSLSVIISILLPSPLLSSRFIHKRMTAQLATDEGQGLAPGDASGPGLGPGLPSSEQIEILRDGIPLHANAAIGDDHTHSKPHQPNPTQPSCLLSLVYHSMLLCMCVGM